MLCSRMTTTTIQSLFLDLRLCAGDFHFHTHTQYDKTGSIDTQCINTTNPELVTVISLLITCKLTSNRGLTVTASNTEATARMRCGNAYTAVTPRYAWDLSQ